MLDANLTEYAIKGLEAELAALDERRQFLMDHLQQLQGRVTDRGAKHTTLGRLQTTRAPIAPSAPAPTTAPTARKKVNISTEGRQRIAEAQRARWAAKRVATAVASPQAPPAPVPEAIETAPEPAAALEAAPAKAKTESTAAKRLAGLARAREAKAAKKADAAKKVAASQQRARTASRKTMPRHVKKNRT